MSSTSTKNGLQNDKEDGMGYAVMVINNPYTGEKMHHVRAEVNCPWAYIYKQKQAIHYKTWADRVRKRLLKAGYCASEIMSVLVGCSKAQCYINRDYYVPPFAIAQRVMDLGIDYFVEITEANV